MKNILCIAGDGIGPEIMKSALEILEVVSKNMIFNIRLKKNSSEELLLMPMESLFRIS